MDGNQKVLEKEIDLIQNCINRMAQNSFVVKGWLITLVTVVLALLPDKINIDILCAVVMTATITFWYLDAFFLKMEKLYRWKYEWVICNRMISDEYKYDLNPHNKKMWLNSNNEKDVKSPSIIRIMFTKTLIPLYGFILVLAALILLNAHCEIISIVDVSIS